jgi:hypothetical protein
MALMIFFRCGFDIAYSTRRNVPKCTRDHRDAWRALSAWLFTLGESAAGTPLSARLRGMREGYLDTMKALQEMGLVSPALRWKVAEVPISRRVD